jgi:hypothetical protein
VGKVGTPFPLGVKDELALQLRPAKAAPEKRESRFEP